MKRRSFLKAFAALPFLQTRAKAKAEEKEVISTLSTSYTKIGENALNDCTAGFGVNTAIGYKALAGYDQNVFIGYKAGCNRF